MRSQFQGALETDLGLARTGLQIQRDALHEPEFGHHLGTRQRLAGLPPPDASGGLRAEPGYPLILRRLVEEAIHALGPLPAGRSASSPPSAPQHLSDGGEEDLPALEVDPRDEVLLHHILDDLGLDLSIMPTLRCWGGVVARSGDGRVVVTNTLEARLERATPFLCRDLAAFFEKEQKEQKEKRELTPVPSVP